MKNKIHTTSILYLALILVAILPGCSKSEYATSALGTPRNIFDLKVSPSFDWKLSKEIQLNVTGMPIPVKIQNTLYVRSVDKKILYFQDLLDMDKDYSITLSVPSSAERLVISYGAIAKTVEISGKTIEFNYSSQK